MRHTHVSASGAAFCLRGEMADKERHGGKWLSGKWLSGKHFGEMVSGRHTGGMPTAYGRRGCRRRRLRGNAPTGERGVRKNYGIPRALV